MNNKTIKLLTSFKPVKAHLILGGHFAPKNGGQFERILQYTPYQFAGNKPIRCIDLDGLEEYDPYIFEQCQEEPILAKIFFAIPDFISNTLMGATHLMSKETVGSKVRSILNSAGYTVSDNISNRQLGSTFKLKMRTGGTVCDPYRGWTLEEVKGVGDEILDIGLDAVEAAVVILAFKSGNDPAALTVKTSPLLASRLGDILRGLKVSARIDELKKTGDFIDPATGRSFRDIEIEGAAKLEEATGSSVKASDNLYDFVGITGKLNGKSISHMGIPKKATGKYKMEDVLGQIDVHMADGADVHVFDFKGLSSADKVIAKQSVYEKAAKSGDEDNVYIFE